MDAQANGRMNVACSFLDALSDGAITHGDAVRDIFGSSDVAEATIDQLAQRAVNILRGETLRYMGDVQMSALALLVAGGAMALAIRDERPLPQRSTVPERDLNPFELLQWMARNGDVVVIAQDELP